MENFTNKNLDNVKAIVFDADGTLMDTYSIILRSMTYTLNEHHGLNLSEPELMKYIGTPLVDQMLWYADGNQDVCDDLVETYRVHNDSIHDEGICQFPGTTDALQKLQDAGYQMAVVTSKRHNIAERGLKICGVNDFMKFIIASDDWPEHKPNPGPIVEACRRLNISPAGTIYVGDSPFDIQAANAAGCISVAALWGMFSKEVVMAENPDIALESLSELPKLLGK